MTYVFLKFERSIAVACCMNAPITILDTPAVRLVELVQLMTDTSFDTAAAALSACRNDVNLPVGAEDDPLALVASALVRIRRDRSSNAVAA